MGEKPTEGEYKEKHSDEVLDIESQGVATRQEDGKDGKARMEARSEQRIKELIGRGGIDGRLAARVIIPRQNIEGIIVEEHAGAVLIEPTLRKGEWEVVDTVMTGNYIRGGDTLTTAELIERLSEFEALVPKQEAGK